MEKKEGWQFWVEVYDDFVVKTPKKQEEMGERIMSYLRSVGKENELEMRIARAVNDLEESEKILKRSNFPREKLANLEFLDGGQIKQNKVVELKEELERVSLEEGKILIKKCVEFILEMWRYGIHEKTFKFYSNFGVFGSEIVLIDPFEITDDKEKVVKQIRKRAWDKPHRRTDLSLRKLFVYFEEVCDELLTLENLERAWSVKR